MSKHTSSRHETAQLLRALANQAEPPTALLVCKALRLAERLEGRPRQEMIAQARRRRARAEAAFH